MRAPDEYIGRTHRQVVSLALALCLVSAASCGPRGDAPPGAPRPNVVLISVDSLRADHMGVYGYHRDTTPRIDAFFEPGSIFENATSTSPCTLPSVRQFLTGAFYGGAEGRRLAEHLRDSGYQTGAIVSQHQFSAEQKVFYTPGFDSFDIQGKHEIDRYGLSTRDATAVSERAIQWLDRRTDGRPFFLWLHYFDPHDPYEPPQAYRSFDKGNASTRSGDRRGYQIARRADGWTPRRPLIPGEPWLYAGDLFSAEDTAHFVNLYDGEIRYADAEIGRFLDRLEAMAVLHDTIVVLTADHGEQLGEGNYWDHCWSLGEPEIHVPFLMRVRGGRLEELSRTRLPVSTIDLLPTLLGQLEIPYDESLYHGSDLARVSPHRTVISIWRKASSIRNREWKLRYRGKPTALIRIGHGTGTRDPNNYLDQEPEVRDEFVRALNAHRLLLSKVEQETEETVRRLKAMGYIQ